MTTVFADTLYWAAIARPNDQWHEPARRARSDLGDVRLLTTDEVLAEFLTQLREGGPRIRGQAVKMVRAILTNPNVEVLPQTRDSFLKGLALYDHRPDQGYSLTDCIAMNAMKARSVTKVLTNDEHFEHEGFEVLIKPVKQVT